MIVQLGNDIFEPEEFPCMSGDDPKVRATDEHKPFNFPAYAGVILKSNRLKCYKLISPHTRG